MAEDWHKVGDDYAGSSSVLIGDVDCTSDGKELCEKFEVRGYPTIKYFKDGDTAGADYQGGRSYDALKQFVEGELEVMCDVRDPASGCNDKEKAYIEKMTGKSVEERAAQVTRLEGMNGKSMKPELKRWLVQRLRILKQFEDAAGEL
jgi:protein disulfide-isomerase A6